MESITVLGPVKSYQGHVYLECICNNCGHVFSFRSGRPRKCPECRGLPDPTPQEIASRAKAIRAAWSYRTKLERKGGQAIKCCQVPKRR